ncbi:MAG: hypothetical protein R6U52_05185 [Kosmotogaceae bacterium]
MKIFTKDIVNCVLLFLISIYLFHPEFSVISLLIFGGFLAFSGYISSRGYGCLSFFIIPIVAIFTIIIANGINNASAENTIFYILAAAGVTLIVNSSAMISIAGLAMIGIYLTLLPVMSSYGDSLFFIILFLIWIMFKYKKVNIVSITLFTVLCVMIIAFVPSIENRSWGLTAYGTETEIEEQVQEQEFESENQYSVADQLEGTDITKIKINNEMNDIDMQKLLPEASLLIILSLGAFIMGYMFWKASSIKGFWKAFTIGLLLIVFVVGIRFLVILIFKNSQAFSVAEGLSFGQGFSTESGDMPNISLHSIPVSEYKEVEVTIPEGFRIFIVFGLTTLAVLILGYIIYSMFSKTREREKREVVEEIPENVPLYPLEKLPVFSMTKKYILGAYWWIRRKYFAGMHHLTPYELTEHEIINKMDSQEFVNVFNHLTEVYVNVHYGNKTVDTNVYKDFESSISKVNDYLSDFQGKWE